MEVRLLNGIEKNAVKGVISRTGLTLEGASLTDNKYYLRLKPESQITLTVRRKLEDALGTDHILINGIVKSEFVSVATF